MAVVALNYIRVVVILWHLFCVNACCTAIQCDGSSLPSFTGAASVIPHNGSFPFAATISYNCPTGHRFEDGNTHIVATCTGLGFWDWNSIVTSCGRKFTNVFGCYEVFFLSWTISSLVKHSLNILLLKRIKVAWLTACLLPGPYIHVLALLPLTRSECGLVMFSVASVCVSVTVSVCDALTIEGLDTWTGKVILVCRHVLRISRLFSHIRVIGSRSRSQEQNMSVSCSWLAWLRLNMSSRLVYRTCAWWRHLVNAYGVISLVRLIAAA